MGAAGESVCLACGACCAALRVSFPEGDGLRVPTELTVVTTPGHQRMRRQPSGACTALRGTVGQGTTCAIYAQRPEPCRAFEPSTPEVPNPYCDEARATFGLPPVWATTETTAESSGD